MRERLSRRDFVRFLAAASVLPFGHAVPSRLNQASAVTRALSGSDDAKRPRVLFGAWEPGPPRAVGALEAALDRPLDIVHWYQGWGAEQVDFDHARARATLEHGATPLVTWEPWDYRQSREQPAYALRRIASGYFDGYVRTWARSLRDLGQPVLLRFAHEMNGAVYPWSVGVNGNRSADYLDAWRRVVRLVREEGADNVAFVWSPLVPSPGSPPLVDCFPGDDYVDVVGMDGYNAGTAADWGGWLLLSDVFGDLYSQVTALSSRPVIIAETGCAEEGGGKARWIADGFLRDLPAHFPAVSAVVWFNEQREANWRLDSSETALEVARVVFRAGSFAS